MVFHIVHNAPPDEKEAFVFRESETLFPEEEDLARFLCVGQTTSCGKKEKEERESSENVPVVK